MTEDQIVNSIISLSESINRCDEIIWSEFSSFGDKAIACDRKIELKIKRDLLNYKLK